MKKDIIFEVFGFLKGNGITASESEFSEHWLGCSESYLRKLRSSQSEPSLGAVAICASRLQNAADQLTVIPCYRNVGAELAGLSGKCRAIVDAEAVEFDLIG